MKAASLFFLNPMFRLLLHPLNKLDKRSSLHTVSVTWEYAEPKTEDNQILAEKIALLRTSCDQELDPMLRTFHSEVMKFYAAGSLSRNRGIDIRMGTNPPLKKLRKQAPLAEVLDNYQTRSRLHSVTSLDPLVYPEFLWPFVACGGESGIVFLFRPQNNF